MQTVIASKKELEAQGAEGAEATNETAGETTNVETTQATEEEALNKYPDLSDIILPGVIAKIHVGDLYIDDAISGRLGGRDEAKFKETKNSILHDGQIEPVGVGLDENGIGILYSGFGRARAIKELNAEGKHDGMINVILWQRDVSGGYLSGVLSNTKREDLNPLQMAGVIETLASPPFKMNGKVIAEKLGIAPSYVRGLRKILELPEDVQAAIRDGKLGPAAAIEYARNPEEGAKIARKQLKGLEGLSGAVPAAQAREAMREAKGNTGGVRTMKELKLMLEEQDKKGLFGEGSYRSLVNGILNFADGFITVNKFKAIVESGAEHARIVKEKPVKPAKAAKAGKKKAAKKTAKKSKKAAAAE
jgi:ParB/RepB/Spo0J family partition protein